MNGVIKTKKEIKGINPVDPITLINPANGYNAYQNLYFDNRKHDRDNHKKHNHNSQDCDYFEKSDEGDAEYLYKSDGTFMETNSNMKRLVKKEAYNMSPITDRAEGDCRTTVQDLAPMYAIDDNSYMNYVNQNPRNKYIMKMRGQLPPEPEIMTLKDYNERYFEDDGFTMRITPKAAATEKRLVRKADGDSSSCDSGSSVDSDGYGCGISSPTVPYYSKEYLKKRKELMDTQQKQRSPQNRKNDNKKSFKDILEDKLRMFYD